jgi:hypothetical protein
MKISNNQEETFQIVRYNTNNLPYDISTWCLKNVGSYGQSWRFINTNKGIIEIDKHYVTAFLLRWV